MTSTVRTVTYDLLRSLGLTTVFGNPGSTEQTWRHSTQRNSLVIAVDPGPVVDPGGGDAPDPPRSPDPPRKCGESGGCACCGAASGARGTHTTRPRRR